MLEQEPIVFRWDGSSAFVGYLGGLRWRVRAAGECNDVPDIVAAVTLVFDVIFRGVPAGAEVSARAPIDLTIGRQHVQLVAEPKFTNGWRCRSSRSDATIGDQELLLPFVASRIAYAAEDAWATGVRHTPPPPLASRFSFEHFAEARNIDALCRDLEAVLNERLRAHPSPTAAFELAMNELKAAGHDLWSWTPGEVWGRDYVTARPGSGLQVTRYVDDDDDDGVANTVTVQFNPLGR